MTVKERTSAVSPWEIVAMLKEQLEKADRDLGHAVGMGLDPRTSGKIAGEVDALKRAIRKAEEILA